MKRCLCVLLATGCVAAVTAAVAPAHTKTFATTTSFRAIQDGVTGKLSSPKAACEASRTIFWTYRSNLNAPFTGSARTDSGGNWKVTFEQPEAGYIFIVRAKLKTLKKNDAHTHRCGKLEKKFAP